MKFLPKCRTKKLGKIYTILGSFCLFFNWERADIRPRIRPRKIPVKDLCAIAYIYSMESHHGAAALPRRPRFDSRLISLSDETLSCGPISIWP